MISHDRCLERTKRCVPGNDWSVNPYGILPFAGLDIMTVVYVAHIIIVACIVVDQMRLTQEHILYSYSIPRILKVLKSIADKKGKFDNEGLNRRPLV